MKPNCSGPARAAGGQETCAQRLCVTAAELAVALGGSVTRFVSSAAENLGQLEAQVAAQAQELLRQATEAGAQQKANATPPHCPQCRRALTQRSPGHARSFTTRFGEITVRRTRGYCPRCRKWRTPADAALGLAGHGRLLARRAGNDRAAREQNAGGRSERGA